MKLKVTRLGGRTVAVAASLYALTTLSLGATSHQFGEVHNVYVESNTAKDNNLLVFRQNPDGSLSYSHKVATGGAGNGGALGQGALSWGENGHLLYAVNAGDNSISIFFVDGEFTTLLQKVSSRGSAPISISVAGDVAYVLNSGGTANVTGFHWNWDSGLVPIENSTRTLSTAAPSAEQVGFSPNGQSLVVTEKGTNKIDLFAVNRFGEIGERNTVSSPAMGPFGFAFGRNNDLVVSEAATGSGSSFLIKDRTDLKVVTSSEGTHQMAPCWVTVTHDGKFAYLADAGSNAISGFSLSSKGALTSLTASGKNAATDPHPIDMTVSSNDRFLYVVSNNGGSIDEFEIRANGELSPLTSITGFPTSISGALSN